MPTGMTPHMADTNTQNQTAATATKAAATPAASSVTTSAKADIPLTELNIDSLLSEELGDDEDSSLDAELDSDLPGMQSKKDKKAPPAKKKEEKETEETQTEEETETEETETEETEEETETEETETETADIGDDEEVDPEKPPKGFENVPKGIWKRQNKLIKAQRELKAQLAQGPVQIAPTPANPLADVESVEALDQRLTTAKAVRDWCRDNPDGGTVKGAGGREVELTPEDVRARMAMAESVIEAAPDVKVTLTQRAQEKPWELAEAIAPGLLTNKASEEHRFMTDIMKAVPELKRHPAWEVFVAAAAKGMRQTVEERTGKAKYVRYELDKDGKMIAPKKAPGEGKKDKAGPDKAKPKAPTPPTATRPALTRDPKKDAEAKKAANSPSQGDSEVAAMLADELGDF